MSRVAILFLTLLKVTSIADGLKLDKRPHLSYLENTFWNGTRTQTSLDEFDRLDAFLSTRLGSEDPEGKEREETVLGWGIFIVFMLTGIALEVAALKTWEADVDVCSACLALLWWAAVSAVFCWYLSAQGEANHIYTWIDGWLLEVMLSFDNLFVFVLIMQTCRIPSLARNRILLTTVIYCFACRLLMFEALALLKSSQTVKIVTQVLGVFIAYCAFKIIAFEEDDNEDFQSNPAVVFLSGLLPVTTERDERGSFFIDGKATSSTIAMLTLIIFDTIFAVDSVSAKSVMIKSTYLNFTSSGFAMIMLRAAYFLLDCAIDMFKCLKYGVGVILFIIAFMAIFPDLLPITNFQYCCILVGIILLTMAVSVIIDSNAGEEHEKLNDSKSDSRNGSSKFSRVGGNDESAKKVEQQFRWPWL